ncbi:MAG: hypothetical protein ACYCW6_27810 [Candidatus Xenobia bacterium]
MEQPAADDMVGTPDELSRWLRKLPSKKRYKLVEVDDTGTEKAVEAVIDPKASASIALLNSWIAEAPTDPAAVQEAEEDLREFKRNMNIPRKETGARLHYPEVE